MSILRGVDSSAEVQPRGGGKVPRGIRGRGFFRCQHVNGQDATPKFIGVHMCVEACSFFLRRQVGPGDDKGAWKIIDPNKRLQATHSAPTALQ